MNQLASVKNLLIMRHAKSSWIDPEQTDFERPLNKRGMNDTPRMAQWLSEQSLTPDLVISSAANRAQTTARLVIDHLDSPTEVTTHFTADLYHASPDSYLEYLSIMGLPYQNILLVGHNPGIEQLVYLLSSTHEFMPTCAIAWFQFSDVAWESLPFRNPKHLIDVWRPKEMNWS